MNEDKDVSQHEEIESLRNKNKELLGKLRAAKDRITELEATIEQSSNSATGEMDKIKNELLDFKVNKPVEALLDSLLVAPKYSGQELAEHFTFGLNEAGVLEMRDIEGQPVMVTEKVDGKEVSRPIKCEKAEVYRHLSAYGKLNHIIRAWANGGGAGHGQPQPSKSDDRTEAPKPAFGLGR